MNGISETNRFNLPVNLIPSIAAKISDITNEQAIENLKNLSPEELMSFIDCSMEDQKYLDSHEELLKNIWTFIDGSFYTSLTSEQQKKVFEIISTHSKIIKEYLPANCTIIGPKNDQFQSNRLWVSHWSKYFQTQISFSEKQGKVPLDDKPLELDCKEMSSSAFKIIKDFIETGALPTLLNEKIAQKVFCAANEMGLAELIHQFPEKCQITSENAAFYYQLASQPYHFKQLKEKALNCLREALTDPSDISDAKTLYRFAQNHQYSEIEDICSQYIFKHLKNQLKVIKDNAEALNALLVSTKAQEKDIPMDDSVSEAYEFIKGARKILSSRLEAIPKEFLEKLSSQELLILMQLVPEQIQRINLSVYDDYEIASLAQHLPFGVTELNLSGTALDSNTIEIIAAKCRLLNKLNLAEAKKWNIDDPFTPYKADWKSLTLFENLTELDVSSCNDAAPYLEKMLQKNANNLVALRMGNCHLNTVSEDFLFGDRCLRILGKCGKKLKELDISDIEISGKALSQLYLNNHLCHRLEVLSLSNNCSLKKSDLRRIGYQFCHLRSLNLSNVKKLDANILVAILSQLRGYPNEKNEESKLEELKIKFSPLSSTRYMQDLSEGMIQVIARSCPNLKTLTFDTDRMIDWDEMELLAKGCPQLTRLKMKRISVLALSALADHHLPLTELIAKLPLEDIPQKKLIESAIVKFPELQTLGLLFLGSMTLEKILPRLTKLKNLSYTTYYPGKELELITTYCPKLVKLSLRSGQSLIDKIHKDHFKLFSKLKNLQDLSLDTDIPFKTPNLYHSVFRSMPLIKKIKLKTISLVDISCLTGILERAHQLETLIIQAYTPQDIDSKFETILAATGHLRELRTDARIDEKLLLKLLITNPRLVKLKFFHPEIKEKEFLLDQCVELHKTSLGEPILIIGPCSDAEAISKFYPHFKVVSRPKEN